jgi:hypothetical protein
VDNRTKKRSDEFMTRPAKSLLVKYDADYAKDTEFSALCRLLQSKWRKKKRYPKQNGKFGNYLPIRYARETKANFLTERIGALVQYEIHKAKIDGRMISEPRIWNNLLSSQPLCFNLFGELHYDITLATKFFRILFPNNVKEVTSVKFEYSPGPGNPKYTGDHSAFDVFIEYDNKRRKKGFIGIEVKYAENMRGDNKKAALTFNKHKKRYLSIAQDAGIFPEPSIQALKELPLQQIWRDHLLAFATRKDYDEGFFVFLYPEKNRHCHNAVSAYINHLSSRNEKNTIFCPRTLETFVRALYRVKRASWVKELRERYLGIK